MDIVQTFYDDLASQYDKLFMDWQETTREQAVILDRLFADCGFGRSARVLDCACGIGTQAIGLAKLGYPVTSSDISLAELTEAEKRAEQAGVEIRLVSADFRALQDSFAETFDILIAMDNALPHMLCREELEKAVESIAARLREDGLFVGSIRDYDALLRTKPAYAPPYIHKTEKGQRVCFQTWDWEGDRYRLIQYIIEDEGKPRTEKFACEYRATRREELTGLFEAAGCRSVRWLMPEQTGFYQPIIMARK